MYLEQAMAGGVDDQQCAAFFGRELVTPPTRRDHELTLTAGQNLSYGVSVYSWHPPDLEAI
jgi:hypothetical protein